jgi:uncharacterized protein YbbK (DUF523 family)
MKLCSACLLGLKCRYNNKRKRNAKVFALSKREVLIPICPEQLGGLSTPREPAEIKKGKVFTRSGKDVTSNYRLGAREVLRVARQLKISEAILKQRSPACGYGVIYDGTFSKNTKFGYGITAKLLKKNGIKIITEKEL